MFTLHNSKSVKLLVTPSHFSSFNLIGHRKYEMHDVRQTVFSDTLTKEADKEEAERS